MDAASLRIAQVVVTLSGVRGHGPRRAARPGPAHEPRRGVHRVARGAAGDLVPLPGGADPGGPRARDHAPRDPTAGGARDGRRGRRDRDRRRCCGWRSRSCWWRAFGDGDAHPAPGAAVARTEPPAMHATSRRADVLERYGGRPVPRRDRGAQRHHGDRRRRGPRAALLRRRTSTSSGAARRACSTACRSPTSCSRRCARSSPSRWRVMPATAAALVVTAIEAAVLARRRRARDARGDGDRPRPRRDRRPVLHPRRQRAPAGPGDDPHRGVHLPAPRPRRHPARDPVRHRARARAQAAADPARSSGCSSGADRRSPGPWRRPCPHPRGVVLLLGPQPTATGSTPSGAPAR